MIWKDLGLLDRFILGVTTLALCISTYLISDDRWLFQTNSIDTSKLKKVGTVTQSENDVRRRFKVAFSWFPIKRKEDIYQGDSIFTGSASEAVIQTETGDELRISENSLVVISSRTDSIMLDIGYGSIQGRIDRDKKLLITSKDGVTEFSGANALVKVDLAKNQSLTVNVLQGQVRLKDESGSTVLTKDQGAEIGRDGRVIQTNDKNIEIITPLSEIKVREQDVERLNIKWRSESPYKEFNVEFAEDEKFENIVKSEKTEESHLRPGDLPKNKKLFVRIVGEGNKLQGLSNIIPITVVTDAPAEPVFPSPKSTIAFEETTELQSNGLVVNLQWESPSPIDRWEVQISRDNKFQKNVTSYTTLEPTKATPLLPSGTYYWRVRSKDWKNAKWMKPVQFTVERRAPLVIKAPTQPTIEERFTLKTVNPKNISAEQMSKFDEIRSKSLIEKVPTLNWPSVAGIHNYEIQIAKNQNFSEVITKASVNTNSYSWDTARPGDYFWRVRSVAEDQRRSSFAKPQLLRVNVAAPSAKPIRKIIEEVPDPDLLETAPPPFELRWDPTVFAKQYEVQFDQSDKFTKPLQFLTKQTNKKVQTRKPGIYYWRVRALNQRKQPLSDFSEPFIYSYHRVYKDGGPIKDLRALYPNQGETLVFVGGGENTIYFRWSTPFQNANKYIMQISNEPDFKKILFEGSASNGKMVYNKKLPDGWIFWRVRAEGKDFQTKWTAANRFQIKQETQAFNYDDSERIQDEWFKKWKERQEQVTPPTNIEKNYAFLKEDPAAEKARELPTPQNLKSPVGFTMALDRRRTKVNENLTHIAVSDFQSWLVDYPQFNWQAVTQALQYRIEIAHDRGFNAKIISSLIKETEFKWKSPQPGLFYWRVQAIGADEQMSRFSVGQPLLLQTELPTALTDSTYSQTETTESTSKPIDLRWTSVAFARGYVLELSPEADFKNKKVLRPKSNSQKIKISQSGRYFWRLRAVDKFDRPIGDFTKPFTITVSFSRLPANNSPLTGIRPNERKLYLFKNLGKVKMPVEWRTTQAFDAYEVEVALDEAFVQIIHRQRFASPHNNFIRADLPQKVLYWRVTGVRKGQHLDKSTPLVFKVKRERRKPIAQKAENLRPDCQGECDANESADSDEESTNSVSNSAPPSPLESAEPDTNTGAEQPVDSNTD